MMFSIVTLLFVRRPHLPPEPTHVVGDDTVRPETGATANTLQVII